MKTQLLTFEIFGSNQFGHWFFKSKGSSFIDCFNRLSKKHKKQCIDIILNDESIDSDILQQLKQSI